MEDYDVTRMYHILLHANLPREYAWKLALQFKENKNKKK